MGDDVVTLVIRPLFNYLELLSPSVDPRSVILPERTDDDIRRTVTEFDSRTQRLTPRLSKGHLQDAKIKGALLK